MNITALQLNLHWLNAELNILAAERLMNSTPGSDLYVLPEMWATGFCTQPTDEVMQASKAALAWMKEQAAKHNAAVAGSLAVCEAMENEPSCLEGAVTAARWRNRFYFALPSGEVYHYDKRHLFAYGGEHRFYVPGTEREVVPYKGVRFLLQTCFDLRFPETGRNLLSAPYDVVLYAASWPASRQNAWNALLTARAIENQAYCLGVNRTGSDPQCAYNGGSAATDAYGHQLFCLNNEEQTGTFSVDLDSLHHLREKFPVLQ